MLLALAVLLGMLGFALLVLGEVKLPGGRTLRAWPGRFAGLVFLSFLPLVLAARLLVEHYVSAGEEWAAAVSERYLPALSWGLLGLCLVVGMGIVLRGSRSLVPQRPVRGGLAGAKNLFAKNPFAEESETASLPPAPGPSEPTPRPPAKRGHKPVRRQEPEDPFDFS
jgi:hypothetical protein